MKRHYTMASKALTLVGLVSTLLYTREAQPKAVEIQDDADSVERLLPYRGILELGGKGVEGPRRMTFSLYKDDTDLVYSETQTVEVVGGRFSVLIGSAGNAASGMSVAELIARRWDLYLRVSVEDSNGGMTQLEGSQRLGPVPYAMTALSASVPVGGVIDWFGDLSKMPYGYALADGSKVDDPTSPLVGQTLPDLRGRFTRGAEPAPRSAATAYGSTGGSTQHAHRFVYEVASSVLTGTTQAAGNHNHLWAWWDAHRRLWSSYDTYGRDNAIMSWGNGLDEEGSGYYPLSRSDAVGGNTFFTTLGGEHTHGLALNVPKLSINTVTEYSESGSASTPELGDSLPPYMCLWKIIRIK